jgi:hypothetical protein
VYEDLPPALAGQLHAAQAEDDRRAAADADPRLLVTAAHWYVEVLGWPVFPLTPQAKTPHGRLAPHGFKDASTELAVVTAWWQHEPTANIGTPTGLLFDVIDIDGPAGYQSYVGLRDSGGLPQVLARSMTGVGQHLLIPATPEFGNAQAVWPGVDIRGTGGYIVLPPSLHPCGRRYRWDDTHAPLSLPVAA